MEPPAIFLARAQQVHLSQQLLNTSFHLFTFIPQLVQIFGKSRDLLFGRGKLPARLIELRSGLVPLISGSRQLFIQRLVLASKRAEKLNGALYALLQTCESIYAFFVDGFHGRFDQPLPIVIAIDGPFWLFLPGSENPPNH